MNFCKIVAFATLMGAPALFAPIYAQQRVDKHNLHERIIAVVPFTGAGTYADPKRPLFAPVRPSIDGSGIRSYFYEAADDARFAIVEFVAGDRAAFAPILNDNRVARAFSKGSSSREEIEREIKRFKRDFNFDKFMRRAR